MREGTGHEPSKVAKITQSDLQACLLFRPSWTCSAPTHYFLALLGVSGERGLFFYQLLLPHSISGLSLPLVILGAMHSPSIRSEDWVVPVCGADEDIKRVFTLPWLPAPLPTWLTYLWR